MPFPLIPTALVVSFFLVWVFIGGMILRDGQLAAKRERDLNVPFRGLSKRVPRSEAA